MICKTIQHKNVALQLHRQGKYVVSQDVSIAGNLSGPYKFMMKHYNYKNRPIFLAPVGYYVNFSGASLENACLMTLDIPERFIKVQDYYMWSDFIYFTEMPQELQRTYNVKDINELGRMVLNQYIAGIEYSDTVYQVTTQFLLKSWLRKVEELTPQFIDTYIDTGGVNILR